MYVGNEERPGPIARGSVKMAAAARPTRVGPRARVILPFGFCLSEGRTGDVPSRGAPPGKRRDQRSLRSLSEGPEAEN